MHEKGTFEIPLYSAGSQFQSFFAGYSDAVLSRDNCEDILERVRFFAEECSSLGGITILADTVDGFGGLASHIVEQLRDDYASTPIV